MSERSNSEQSSSVHQLKKKNLIILGVVIIFLIVLLNLFDRVDRDGVKEVGVVEGDAELVLPSGFPQDVPLLDNAQLERSVDVSEGENGISFSAAYLTELGRDEALDFFQRELNENGWKIKKTDSLAGTYLIQSEKENLYVSIQFPPEVDGQLTRYYQMSMIRPVTSEGQ